MAFALETVLLLLFRLACARNMQDIEIVLLPLWNAKDTAEVPLSFKAFDRSIELSLRRNDKIMAPGFQVWKHGGEDSPEVLLDLSETVSCHYLHRNNYSSAAISLCQGRGLHGLVFLENATLEITPLQREKFSVSGDHFINHRSEVLGEPHVVKRAYIPLKFHEDQPKYRADGFGQSESESQPREENFNEEEMSALENLIDVKKRNRTNEALTLELALFFDEAAYALFSPFFDGNDEAIRDLLLAYVNGVQAVYHHPSLGPTIDISLVRLDIMQKQPRDLPHHDGERGKLLDSFCSYASRKNPPDVFHPNHWDMALYVSGLDFYVQDTGRKNSATMGLAVVGGLCIEQYSCVIAELGVTNQFGKPFPSAGFTSVYIAAHEIGHNLGMHHDSIGNSCPKDGYIMSPSRGTYGETVWSECSREVAQKLSYTKPCIRDRHVPPSNNDRLDHTRYFNLPGRVWTAKRQCEVLLRDKDAVVVTFYKACESLQCRTPHRSGYYFAGPALDGTYCAPGKECRGGECKNSLQIHPGSGGNEPPPYAGRWSSWKIEPCKSGCLQRSTGAQTKQRFCEYPRGAENAETGCQGLHYDVALCRDDNLCKWKRKSATEFARLRCAEFGERLPELDGKGGGLQAPHEPERPWMACAIFCRRKDIASYYTPRVELNDLGLDPYFPDGTWCHAAHGQNYFCRQHHCLPDTFRFEKTSLKEYRPSNQNNDGDGDDDNDNDDAVFGPQNAHADSGLHLDDQVIRYLSLGIDGLPLLTSLSHGIGYPPEEDEWIDKDYVEPMEPGEQTDFDLQYHMEK